MKILVSTLADSNSFMDEMNISLYSNVIQSLDNASSAEISSI